MPVPSPTTIGILLPTLRARAHLARCLGPVVASPLRPRILVIDSSSDDGTVEEARQMGAQTMVIPRDQFNHGATREQGRHMLGTDIVVMMTQDACLREPADLDRLIAPVREGRASMAYGRQVPQPGAGYFEAYGRRFNYPGESHIRDRTDVPRLGVYVFFCSNAFAAWSNPALDAIGGFRPALTHEDALAAAMLIQGGHKIAYVAEAVAVHSHRFTLRQEFRRYREAGESRREHRDAFAFAGEHGQLGQAFAKTMLRELALHRPWLLPYAIAHLGTKWLGYRCGERAAERRAG